MNKPQIEVTKTETVYFDIDFKTIRQYNEWESCQLDLKLKNIIETAAVYSKLIFGKTLCITDIWRSKEEELKYGSSGIHNAWRAVDIRIHGYTTDQIAQMVAFLNTIAYRTGSGLLTAIYGDARHKNHIHIQVSY